MLVLQSDNLWCSRDSCDCRQSQCHGKLRIEALTYCPYTQDIGSGKKRYYTRHCSIFLSDWSLQDGFQFQLPAEESFQYSLSQRQTQIIET